MEKLEMICKKKWKKSDKRSGRLWYSKLKKKNPKSCLPPLAKCLPWIFYNEVTLKWGDQRIAWKSPRGGVNRWLC